MTTKEAIILFRNEVINEIYHSAATEEVKDQLVEAVKEAESTVYATIEAMRKHKP